MEYEDLFLTAAVAAVIAFAAPAARAEGQLTLDERVEAAAEQGPDALRQFVWRTRMIYALDIQHYASLIPRQGAAAATDDGAWTGLSFFEEPYAGAWLETAGYAAAQGGGHD
jgi:hypothetical protein